MLLFFKLFVCSVSWLFLSHFSRWTWVSRCLLKQSMMEVVVTTGLLELIVMQSQITTTTNQHPFFYRPDDLPIAQPSMSKHWRENITFHGLAHSKLTLGLPTLSLTTNSSWLPWGRVSIPLISRLIPVRQEYNTAGKSKAITEWVFILWLLWN